MAQARERVCDAIAADFAEDDVETLRLLVSEVVTNAVRHGSATQPVELNAHWNAEVRDRGLRPRRRLHAAAAGRGARRARGIRALPRGAARRPLGRRHRGRHDRLVRTASPPADRCGSVRFTTSHGGPRSWKVTEVSDLRGDRTLMLYGELDIATAPELVDLLARLRHHGHAVTVDMAEVTFMDSTGLTTLMDARKQADEQRLGVQRPAPVARGQAGLRARRGRPACSTSSLLSRWRATPSPRSRPSRSARSRRSSSCSAASRPTRPTTRSTAACARPPAGWPTWTAR